MAISFSVKELAKVINGELISEVASDFKSVGTDTRKDLSGQCFFALKGDNFDANQFLDKAVASQAAVIVCENKEKAEAIKGKTSIVLVEDTLKALQSLGTYWRKKCGVKVVAITGSNGKTTTKEFLSTILSTKYKTHASPGSFNNHWGVPISLLQLDLDHEFAVAEMGMNHQGEITDLCKIAEPNFALVTTVGTAHIGELGSIENIASAKEEIYKASPGAQFAFNLDNEHTINMHGKYKGESSVTFSSFNKEADIFMRAKKLELGAIHVAGHIKGVESEVIVPTFGRHNIFNVLGASSLALLCGMTPEEIWSALPNCKSIWGRNELHTLSSGAKVLFDAYNANFESMSALIKTLFEIDLPGKKTAVIGEMLELGKDSPQLHEELGELIGRTGFENVWFVGSQGAAFEKGLKSAGFDKNLMISDTYKEELAIQLQNMLSTDDVAIIKGSRGIKLEQVLAAWQSN